MCKDAYTLEKALTEDFMIMYFEDVERAMSVLNQAGMRGGGGICRPEYRHWAHGAQVK